METMDLKTLLRLLWSKALWLALGLVVGLGLMFGYTKLMVKPTYSTDVEFYCIGVPGSVSSSEMNSRGTLAATYARLITSDLVLDRVAEVLEGGMTAAQLRGMVGVAADGETGVLSVRVTSTNPELSMHTCRYIAELSPEILNQITEGGKLKPITDETDTLPSPYVPTTRNLALGALLGLIVAAVIVILVEALDNTVSDAQSVRLRVDVPILGEIPEFNTNSSQKRGYVYGRLK